MSPTSSLKYVLVLISCALLSCNSKHLEIPQLPVVQPKSVHIVINNATDSLFRLKLQLGLNDTVQKLYVVSKKLDTLILDLDKEKLVTVESKAAPSQDFVVRPGDSLFVDLVKGKFKLSSTFEDALINRYESQLTSTVSGLQDSLYSTLVLTDSLNGMMAVSNDYSTMVLYPIFFQKEFSQEHPEVIQAFTEAAYADANGLLNKANREGQNQGYSTMSLNEEIQLKRIFGRLSYLARQQKDEAYMTAFLNGQFFDQDFMMQSVFGETYLFQFISQAILEGGRKRTSNRSYIDYPKAYDLLDSYFVEPMLARAKALCLERMVSENETYETISTYATAYQNAYPNDTLFLSSFSENFLLSRESLVKSEIGLNLMLENGSTKMLTELLNELKGKVVYVDYWASWCAPCRVAMPNSLRLKNKLKDEEVAFVYFSIDNGQEVWKKASFSDGLEGYTHNYLVLNHVNSQMKKNLGIDAIPRYLIFDKKGKLVEDKAPGPDDKRLEVVLNKYIGN